MNTLVNPFAPVAGKLGETTASFIDASRSADTASTPFSRSLLATLVGGVATVAMSEMLVIASFGSPKSPSTGKPVKNVSGLRNFEGGARLYQAWKDVLFIVENIDADEYLIVPGTDADKPEGEAGKAAIRPLVTAFILGEGDVKALFGAKGLTARVKALMAEHGEAIARLNGIEPEAKEGEEGGANDNGAPQSLSDRATALLVALKDADDGAFIEAQSVLAVLADYIETRWNDVAEATAPADGVTGTVAEAIAA